MATSTVVNANPSPLNNWNHSVVTKPAVIVRAKTVDDVRAAVRGNDSAFPSPILAVGSAHTVTDALRNDGGTMVDVSALSNILGFGKVGGQDVVRVQCGVKLAALHKWLDERVSDFLCVFFLSSGVFFFLRSSRAHPKTFLRFNPHPTPYRAKRSRSRPRSATPPSALSWARRPRTRPSTAPAFSAPSSRP
jgi:FAD binding domain